MGLSSLGPTRNASEIVALGSLTIISSATASALISAWEEHEKSARKPTPWNELGPFYKKGAPALPRRIEK